jgi:hypothetical protein
VYCRVEVFERFEEKEKDAVMRFERCLVVPRAVEVFETTTEGSLRGEEGREGGFVVKRVGKGEGSEVVEQTGGDEHVPSRPGWPRSDVPKIFFPNRDAQGWFVPSQNELVRAKVSGGSFSRGKRD